MKRISVFGMGYVGCVSAACMSRDGHHVIGVDIDEQKVSTLQQGNSPVAEPGLEGLIREQVEAGWLEATLDAEHAIRRSEVAVVAVSTPSAADGSVDTRALERVIETIGRTLRNTQQHFTVVVRSTLLPGILEDRLAPLLERAAGCALGERIQLCNNPEFLRETTAIRDHDSPPFILVGASEPEHAETVFELYPDLDAKRLVTDTRTAAMVKYACNAFHALKVSFANEMGTLSKAFGADGQKVMEILCEDHRLNISPAYLRPGFAFGGSCLPKDVRALRRYAQQQAIHTQLIDAILTSNEAHIGRALQAIRETGCRRIGLVGLSFKAGTDDLRESPQVILAETLLGRGYDLKIYDSGVRVSHLIGTNLAYVDVHLPHLAALLVDDPAKLYQHAELLVVATDIASQLEWKNSFFGEVIDLRKDLVVAERRVREPSGEVEE